MITIHQQIIKLYPKVRLLSYPIMKGCNFFFNYAPIGRQCANVLVDKGNYNEFSIIHNKRTDHAANSLARSSKMRNNVIHVFLCTCSTVGPMGDVRMIRYIKYRYN